MTEPALAPPTAAPSTFGVGQIVALVGSAVVAISSWLEWIKSVQGSDAESSHEGPAKFLIDNTSEPGGLSIGTLLVILGVLGIVGAVLAAARVLALVAGVGGILVGALFMYQINDFLDRVNADEQGVSFGDVVGLGAYLSIVGGAVAIAGAIVSLRSARA
jgi:hypothetical protein